MRTIDIDEMEKKMQQIADYYGFDVQLNQVVEECGDEVLHVTELKTDRQLKRIEKRKREMQNAKS